MSIPWREAVLGRELSSLPPTGDDQAIDAGAVSCEPHGDSSSRSLRSSMMIGARQLDVIGQLADAGG
jgi:hypothetical protein